MAWVEPSAVADVLRENHYLGPTKRGSAWLDDDGVMVFASPTSRRLPLDWLDLTRWCIMSKMKNAGSSQWGRVRKALLDKFPSATTVVSYSDPDAGHNGALYRACNWWWCPTWHRLRPPPSGQGSWIAGKRESVKDRWCFALRDDKRRVKILTAKDSSVLKRMPWATYVEPGGADFKAFRSMTGTA